jgi:phage baseplate assembly protein W
MDPGELFGRGIGFPPRVGPDGRVAWSEGEENVRETIRILLMTRPGERLFLKDFGAGLDRSLFEPNTVTTRQVLKDRIAQTLQQWEQRISLESVEVDADPDDAQSAIAAITYQLVATQARERINVSVKLGG